MLIEALLIVAIILLVALVVLAVFFIVRKKEEVDYKMEIKEVEQEVLIKMAHQIGDLKEHLANTMALSDKKSTDSFIMFSDKTMKTIEEQIEKINKRVDSRLGEGFEQTNKTFENVIERLAKIDEAQKNIESLSSEVVLLSNVLTDKKTRGTFGEMQLEQIFESIFGPNKEEIYAKQYKLDNNNIADMVLFGPEPLGTICIDSKFPLENYQRMYDVSLSDDEKVKARKSFENDVKKHIDDISIKYIVEGQTASQAIMFVPAEAIFAEIGAHHEALIKYAFEKRVVLTSPTTLMYTLSLVHVILRDIKRNKYADEIKKELNKLSVEFKRFGDRWDRFRKNITTITKSADELDITSGKIIKKFDQISKVDKELIEKDSLEGFDELEESVGK